MYPQNVLRLFREREVYFLGYNGNEVTREYLACVWGVEGAVNSPWEIICDYLGLIGKETRANTSKASTLRQGRCHAVQRGQGGRRHRETEITER